MKIMLDNIIKECLSRGVDVSVSLAPDGSLAYDVGGFSKSGTARLYIGDDCVVCETRYNRIDHVLNFNDLAFIAYDWFFEYKEREPFMNPDPMWIDSFKEFNVGTTNLIKSGGLLF